MEMFKHILVPLDGSPRAERAILVAARIACLSSASIILVRVVETPLEYPSRFALPALPNEDEEKNRAATYLEQVAQSDDLKGLAVQTVVAFGSPALKLLET